ncbi:hypothetical protein CJO79_20205 (plasmid) [Ralstonia solanacearum]|nr:hypothetical protein CJO76_20225 [Ralstonia solanacearum]AXV93304.1 hypothetical protein CJO79_20205 [Ralstonia solanacearum]AXW21342.1 hypothetical protein CJO85_20285 [Ralstonia solanacearum]AXW78201.1 hypothetical protein CJO97_20205 [Ralstonia solanacearum]
MRWQRDVQPIGRGQQDLRHTSKTGASAQVQALQVRYQVHDGVRQRSQLRAIMQVQLFQVVKIPDFVRQLPQSRAAVQLEFFQVRQIPDRRRHRFHIGIPVEVQDLEIPKIAHCLWHLSDVRAADCQRLQVAQCGDVGRHRRQRCIRDAQGRELGQSVERGQRSDGHFLQVQRLELVQIVQRGRELRQVWLVIQGQTLQLMQVADSPGQFTQITVRQVYVSKLRELGHDIRQT